MTGTNHHRRPWFLAAVLLSAGQVALVWCFRFLPLYDYAVWLYEGKIVRDIIFAHGSASRYYELCPGPIPNSTFTLFCAFLGGIASDEIGGKLFLSACVIGLPWAWWYAVRKQTQDSLSPVAFLGFPFAFHYYLLGAQNYSLGLVMVLWIAGAFVPRLDRLGKGAWLLLSLAITAVYFTHGIMFLILLVLLGATAWSVQPTERRQVFLRLSLAIIPAFVFFIWYVLAGPENLATVPRWDLITLARNAAKPFSIFFKSYGVPVVLPVTICNALWLMMLGVFIVRAIYSAIHDRTMKMHIVPVVLACAAALVFLPDPTLSVVQPGARFGLPLLAFACVALSAVRLSPSWNWVWLAWAGVALVYNTAFFDRFNRQACLVNADVQEVVLSRQPSYIMSFDWPAGSSVWDKGSPSVNGLSFVPVYSFLETGGCVGVFETGWVRLRKEWRDLYPEIKGATTEEWYASIFRTPTFLSPHRAVVVFGHGVQAADAVRSLQSAGYRIERARAEWSVLVRGSE